MSAQEPFKPRRLGEIAVGQIEYAVGALRGFVTYPQISADLRANLDQAIEHVRTAARFVDRCQREARPARVSRRRKPKIGGGS